MIAFAGHPIPLPSAYNCPRHQNQQENLAAEQIAAQLLQLNQQPTQVDACCVISAMVTPFGCWPLTWCAHQPWELIAAH